MTVATRDTTALAMVERPSHALAAMIYEHASAITPFLPEGVTLDRVVAGVGLCLIKTPGLARCSPQSVILGVAKIAQWGLEIGETAYLVPYGSEATPIRDYKGDIELLVASGACRGVEAHCVYENDEFSVAYGTNGELKHRPMHRTTRGKMIGAYAVFRQRFGYSSHLYLTVEEIEEVRQKYSKQWKAGPLPVWYACKTVIKRGAKMLPRNPRLAKVLALFDDEEEKVELDPALEVRAPISATASVVEEPAAASSDTGEQATDAQVALIEQLAKSHHWTADELLAIRRRLGAATKEKAAKMIDGMTSTMKEREAAEKLAASLAEIEQAGDGLPGKSDELPF